MQNPDADTEWNDVLRKKGILPPKEPEITEEAIADMIEKTIYDKQSNEARLGNLDLDELDELEDDEDEAILIEFRNKRISEIKAQAALSKFGEVEEITGQDYIEKVNNAGDGIWVFLHLYRQGLPMCTQINEHFRFLSSKYPQLKFLKSISTTCIPNYPDHNLPTIFVYSSGQMKKQFIGPIDFGGEKLTRDELEWMLSKTGAFNTDIEKDPRKPKIKDVLMSSLRKNDDSDSSDNDW